MNSKNKSYSNIALIIIVFICFGYPIQGAIPIVLGMNSTIVSIFIRSGTVIILFSILALFLTKRRTTLSSYAIPFILFWVIYSLRIIYDLKLINIDCAACISDTTVIGYAFGQNLLPILTAALVCKYWDSKFVFNTVFIINFIAGFLLLLFFYKYAFTGNMDFLGQRVRITNDPTDPSSRRATLGVAHFMVTGTYWFNLSLFAVIFLRNNFVRKLGFISLPLSFFLLTLGGGRSPYLIILFISFYLLIMYFLSSKVKSVSFVKIVTFFVLSLIPLSFILNSRFIQGSLGFNRLKGSLDQYSSDGTVDETRASLVGNSLNQFAESPIFGSSIIEKVSQHFPHNVYVEVLLATGIIGGAIFLYILCLGFKKVIVVSLRKDMIYMKGLCVIYLQILLGNFIGGSLWGAPMVWLIPIIFLFTKKEFR